MSHPDSDLLRKAAATMRTERTGHNAGSGFTRARVLNGVRAQRKKRTRWWRIGLPVGILLAGTTAWASASGRLPEMLVNISTLLNMPLTDNGSSERSLAAKSTNPLRSLSTSSDGANAAVEPTSPALGVTPEPSTADAVVGWPLDTASSPKQPIAALDVVDKRSAPSVRASSRPRGTARPPAEPSATVAASTQPHPTPPPPELDVEIRAFRRADDYYRRSGDFQAAISAYRQYIRDYPTGRFVPEAKYNMALSLLKLGRSSEARPLLIPFAEGAYGRYRREAAQKLLDALR